MLKAYGYNPKNILPIAKTIDFVSEDLIAAYKMSRNKRDLTAFLEAYLYSLSLTATNVANAVKETYENKSTKIGKMQEELNERQVRIIEYLEVEKRISRKQYAKQMGISFMTAFRDLLELLEKGYIVQKGKGRATYYILPRTNEEDASSNIQNN
jgi:Fic family protein